MRFHFMQSTQPYVQATTCLAWAAAVKRVRALALVLCLALAFVPERGGAAEPIEQSLGAYGLHGKLLLSTVTQDDERLEQLFVVSLPGLEMKQFGPQGAALWNGVIGNGRVFANTWGTSGSAIVEVRDGSTLALPELGQPYGQAPTDVAESGDLLYTQWAPSNEAQTEFQYQVLRWNINARGEPEGVLTETRPTNFASWGPDGAVAVLQQGDLFGAQPGRLLILESGEQREIGLPRFEPGHTAWNAAALAVTRYVNDSVSVTEILDPSDGSVRGAVSGWTALAWVGDSDQLIVTSGNLIGVVRGPAWAAVEPLGQLPVDLIWGGDWSADGPA
jgi:hypothetical protein